MSDERLTIHHLAGHSLWAGHEKVGVERYETVPVVQFDFATVERNLAEAFASNCAQFDKWRAIIQAQDRLLAKAVRKS